MRHGKGAEADAEWLKAAASEEGFGEGFFKDVLPDKPVIPFHLIVVYEAFRRLSAQRPSGFSAPSKIPFGEIVCYHRAVVPFLCLEDFADQIIALDDIYIQEVARMLEQRNPKGGQ